jgi:hypothetical protein
MGDLVLWKNYMDQMKIGEDNEVHCLEFSPSRGDATVRSLFLSRISESLFQLSIRLASLLAHTEEADLELDEEDNYIYPEEINGEQVMTQLGDYWVGYDFQHYPDETNIFEFKDIQDPGIADWLEKNGWVELHEITPEEEVT